MRKSMILFTMIAIIILPFCTSSRKGLGDNNKPEVKTSYVTDIAPIMQARCTPCHFPDGGKKKFLDTYAAVSTNIDDIIHRIELPVDSVRFMPFKSKKEPLNDSLIQVFKLWKAQNMPN